MRPGHAVGSHARLKADSWAGALCRIAALALLSARKSAEALTTCLVESPCPRTQLA